MIQSKEMNYLEMMGASILEDNLETRESSECSTPVLLTTLTIVASSWHPVGYK